MEESLQHTKSQSFDIKNYVLKLIAHWYLFALSVTIGVAYSIFDSRFIQNIYTINATMMLSDDLQSTQAIVGGLNLFDKRKNYENEFGVLKSYALNETAIKDLDFTISYFKDENFRTDIELYKSSPFLVVLDTTKNQSDWMNFHLTIVSENEVEIYVEDILKKKKLKLGQSFESDFMNFKIIKNEKLNPDFKQLIGNEYYFYKNNLNSLVKSYQSSVNVDLRSPNSSILWLWIEGTVPEKIVDYLNKLTEVYIRQSFEDKNRIVYNTIKFIDTQLEGVVDSLDDVGDKLQLFKQANKVLDMGKEADMLFQEYDKLQQEKKLLDIKENFYEYFKKDLEQNNELTNTISPSFLDIQDPVLESIIEQYQKLKSEIEILNYDVKKNVPNLDIANLKLVSLQKELKNHIETSLKAISYNRKDVTKKLEFIDSSLRKIPSVQREIENIQRRYKLNDNIYTFLLEKRTEAGITMASNSPGAKILDKAKYENVILKSPQAGGNRTKIIFISLLIPLLIIIGKDYFNNKIIDKADIEKSCSLPILGSISQNELDVDFPVQKYPKSPVAESFRLVKTNLQFLLHNCPNPIISINSTVAGEGKTFCSSNLAILYARSKKKTLIIGLDLRKPRTHVLFNIPNSIGLSTFLIGNNTKEEVIFKTGIDNLYVMPSGPIPPNPAELIESEKMKDLMEELKQIFDYIIFDTPPIAHVTDPLLLAKFADANIFVMRQNYSSKNVLKIVNELNATKKMSHMGIIINDVNPSMIFGLKYGYGFSYGYNFGYGYEEGQGYYDIPVIKTNFFKRISSKFYTMLKKLIS